MFGTLLTDLLAERVPAQEVDEDRPGEDRNDQRDERGDENAGHLAGEFRRNCFESH